MDSGGVDGGIDASLCKVGTHSAYPAPHSEVGSKMLHAASLARLAWSCRLPDLREAVGPKISISTKSLLIGRVVNCILFPPAFRFAQRKNVPQMSHIRTLTP